jgi:hypothetical protein
MAKRLPEPPARKRRTLSEVSEETRVEIAQDLAACNAYVDKHGSPPEMLREHLAKRAARSNSRARGTLRQAQGRLRAVRKITCSG